MPNTEPANLLELSERRQDGEIAPTEYLELVQRCRDAKYWHTWAMRALLVLGGGHFLAGVVFFFAYNWDDLSSFAKFGLLQFAIIGSFAAALAFRLDKPAGQAALICASVFTGVLFAVIGQTYQTGADAWELFTAWSVLILPWALASRSSAHWFLWIVVCMTAISLYGEQRLVALGRVDRYSLTAVLGVLPIAFLAVRELALRLGRDWLAGNWMRRSLVVISMGVLFIPALQYIFDYDRALPGFLAYVGVTLVVAVAYARLLPDFSILAILVAFTTLIGMAIGGRMIDEMVDFSDSAGTLVFGLFLLGGWCALLTAGSVKILRYLYPRMKASAVDE